MNLASWQFVALVVAASAVTSVLPSAARKWVLVALSIVVVGSAGLAALAAASAIVLVTWLVTRYDGSHRVAVRIAATAVLWMGIFGPKVAALWGVNPAFGGHAGIVGQLGGGVGLSMTYLCMQAIAVVSEAPKELRLASVGIADMTSLVSFFSHVQAGPVFRPGKQIRQLLRTRAVNSWDLWYGMELIATGLIKKIALADPYMAIARSSQSSGWPVKALLLVCAPMAAYCDVSALVDIARGASRCLGIELPRGFARPLTMTRTPSEFWRRWQTHLMSWFRTYVYQPVQSATGRGWLALGATFVVAALWHSISWKWLAMGLLVPVIIEIERRAKNRVLNLVLVAALFAGLAFAIGTSTFLTGSQRAAAAFVEVPPSVWDVAVTCAVVAVGFALFDLDEADRLKRGDDRDPQLLRAVLLGVGLVGVIIGSAGPATQFIYQGF